MALTLEQIKAETWAISPSCDLGELAQAVRDRGKSQANQAEIDAFHRNESRVNRQGSVAMVTVKGVLVRGQADRYLNWRRHRNTGFDDIREQLYQARDDAAVTSIALMVDSPGGVAAGLDQLAREITEVGKVKPVTAYVTGMAASAAYFLASAAGRIVSERDATIGSIGVYGVLIDSSKALEDYGLKVHVIRSGPFKGTGTVGDAISDEQLAEIQERIDDLAEGFTAQVAAGRRMNLARAQVLATGQAWTAVKALDLGLIDDFGTLSEAATSGPPHPTFRSSKEDDMPGTNETNKVEAPKAATADEIKAKFGDEPGFCMDQLVGKATMDQAERAYDRLKREQAEKRADEAEARAKAAEEKAAAAPKGGSGGVDPETLASGGSGGDDGAPVDFRTAARELAEEKGITLTQAMQTLARRDNDGHRDWVDTESVNRGKKTRRRA